MVGVDVDRIDKLAQREGFAVDMFSWARAAKGPDGDSSSAAYNPVHLRRVTGTFTDKS